MIHQLTVQSRKLLVYKGQGATNGNTRFFMSKTSLSNAKLKLAKKQANAKQQPQAELLQF